MILVDAGPLVALIDSEDPYHAICVEVAAQLPNDPMLTTWPCFTEAMYLLGRSAGAPGQESLWSSVERRAVRFWDIEPEYLARMAELMKQYRDLPMDVADASLVVAAEVTGLRKVFSLDKHFRIYRLKDGSVLEVVP